jgi:predicted alpha/beta hydrolase family esterase
MTRRLLFVQGGGGENAHDEWDIKLVESLERELGPDYEISYPRMPDENSPKFARWKAALRKELQKLDDGAILVGHSIGATILVHTLAEKPPKPAPAGVFLVSMPYIGNEGWQSDDIKPEPNLGEKLPAQTHVYIYQGSADETVPPEHAELNGKAIPQASVRRLSGRDHQLDNNMSEVAADIRELSRRNPLRD